MSDNDFRYLSQELRGEQSKLVQQKVVYPYEYMDRFKTFSEDKLPDRCAFYMTVTVLEPTTT